MGNCQEHGRVIQEFNVLENWQSGVFLVLFFMADLRRSWVQRDWGIKGLWDRVPFLNLWPWRITNIFGPHFTLVPHSVVVGSGSNVWTAFSKGTGEWWSLENGSCSCSQPTFGQPFKSLLEYLLYACCMSDTWHTFSSLHRILRRYVGGILSVFALYFLRRGC